MQMSGAPSSSVVRSQASQPGVVEQSQVGPAGVPDASRERDNGAGGIFGLFDLVKNLFIVSVIVMVVVVVSKVRAGFHKVATRISSAPV